MKYLLLILCFAFSASVFGQNPVTKAPGTPAYTFSGNEQTLHQFMGYWKSKKGLINGIYNDTTEANTAYGDAYAGCQIFTISDNKLWLRNSTGTRWIPPPSGSTIDIFNFINDSTIVICYSSGTCDTLSFVNNVFITNNTTNFTVFNDSTLIICTTPISGPPVCDTISFNIDSINNYYFLNDSTLVACDTPHVITVGDSSYVEQLCDTIHIPRGSRLILQNGLRFVATGIGEFGYPSADPNPSQLHRDTWLYTDFFQFGVSGAPYLRPTFTVQNKQWTQISSSIASFNSLGGNPYQFTSEADIYNPVNLYVNYMDRIIEGNGIFTGDSIGFMYDRIGYALMTNAQGSRASYILQSNTAKQSGIMLHTFDTQYTDAVTIFGKQVPSGFAFSVSPFPTETLLDYRIAVFKTDGTVQFPDYTTTAHRVSDSTNYKPLVVDVDGNVYRSFWLGGGGSLFGVDDNVSFGDRYFDGSSDVFTLDNFVGYFINANGFAVSNQAGTQPRVNVTSTVTELYSPDGNNALRLANTFSEWLTATDIQLTATGGGVADVGINADGTIGIGGTSTLTLSGSEIYMGTIPYNSGAGMVGLVLDTVVGSPTFGKVFRKTVSGGTTPTLQQVFNTEIGGSVLTKTDTILLSGNNIRIFGNSNSATYLLNNNGFFSSTNTGAVTAITATSGTTTALIATTTSSNEIIYLSTNPASTNTVVNGITIERATSGTAASGIGAAIQFQVERDNGSANTPSNILKSYWTDVTPSGLTSQFDITGVNAAASEVFINIQTGGIVRVNNLADTLSTKAYARSVGGSGTVTSFTFTDSHGFDGTVTNSTTTPTLVLGLTPFFEEPYQYRMDASTNSAAFYEFGASGSGAAITLNAAIDGWIAGRQFSTGTTTTGLAFSHFGTSGAYAPISMNATTRFNFQTRVRLEDLSDGTETYEAFMGFGDFQNSSAGQTDGVYFTYTHSVSSGQWVCVTENNNTQTTSASGVTVAADTDYLLTISVYDTHAIFYINGTQVADITTNIPYTTARSTSVIESLLKSAGTTARLMYVEKIEWGKMSY